MVEPVRITLCRNGRLYAKGPGRHKWAVDQRHRSPLEALREARRVMDHVKEPPLGAINVDVVLTRHFLDQLIEELDDEEAEGE